MYSLIFVSVLWAFSFGLIKGQLTGIEPSLVAAIRLLLCFVTFALFCQWKTLPKNTLKLIGLGAVQFGVMYWAYIQSYQYLPGYLVAVFTIFTPLYVMLFSALFNRHFNSKLLLPVLFSIIGAAIIVAKTPETGGYLVGFFILQSANIAFAFGQVVFKHINKAYGKTKQATSHVTQMTLMYGGGAIFSILVVLLKGNHRTIEAITLEQWQVLGYLGVIASGLGFSLWNYGAKHVKAAQLAIMNNGYIPLAVIFSLTLFGEQADIGRLILGGITMGLSLWWAQKLANNS